jgi:O-succinylbenzoate synthase
MKIDQIRMYQVSMPLVSPFETSFGSQAQRDCVLVEVISEGLSGWGECPADKDPGYSYETATTAWHILRDFLCPAAIANDLVDPADFSSIARHVTGHPLAKAGLEMALWDLAGRRSGQSLRTLFGGVRDRVEVGVSVGLQPSPQHLVETIAGYLDDGYGRVKIKIKPGRDVGDTAAARSAYPDLPIQVDANSAYDLASAHALDPLDDLELLLIEQPLAEDDLWDHRTLQQRFRTPICLDESITSPRHARQALEMDACKIINIKPARVGGYGNAIQIHDLCQEAGVIVWCGGMLETGLGRAANVALASLPGFALPGDISATARYYHQDITHERFTINSDSTISVPQGPGLGVNVDREALARFTQAELSLS